MTSSMWKLTEKLASLEENELNIKTTDFFRQPLCQIGASVYDIKEHYTSSGKLHVVPSSLQPDLLEVKTELLARLDDYRLCLSQGSNPATDEVVPTTITDGVLIITRSLPALINLEASEKPADVKCDVLLILQFQPVLFLTILSGDSEHDDCDIYNIAAARGLTTRLIEHLSFDFKPVPGVLNVEDLKDTLLFNEKITEMVNTARLFLPREPFSMNIQRYESVLVALWASVARCSLNTEPSSSDHHHHHLTKEQCVLLVENIDSHAVKVKAVSGSGATTLMLNVALRLSRKGRSLFVCKSWDDKQALRKFHDDTICGADIDNTDLSPYKSIVDETNALPPDEDTSVWNFDTAIDKDSRNIEDMSIGELRETCLNLQEECHNKDVLISKLESKLEVSTGLHSNVNIQIGQIVTFAEATQTDIEMEDPSDARGATDKKRRLTPSPNETEALNQPSKKLFAVTKYPEDGAIAGTSEPTSMVQLNCPEMQYDTTRVNTSACHINELNQLVNSRIQGVSPAQGIGGFKKYWGTSTLAPLTLSTSNLLPFFHQPTSPSPKYWESTTDVKVKAPLKTLPLLEMGLSEESDLDLQYWVCRLPRSWCIRVDVCGTHSKRICTQVHGQGVKIRCLPEPEAPVGTIPNVANTEATVHYGVVVDMSTGRIGFLDLDREVVLHKFQVEFKETVYPLFGVGRIQDKVDVKMRLISGGDIVMTEKKRSLIAEALLKKSEEA